MHDPDASITPDEFRALFRHHPDAVPIVVAHDARGVPVGFTSTSVVSVSAEPPILAFSIATASSSWPAIRDSGEISISFLSADQAEVAHRFSTHGIDRFAPGGWHTLTSGEVVIDDAPAWLTARVERRVDAGNSHVIVAEIRKSGGSLATGARLIYADRTYRALRPAALRDTRDGAVA